MIQAQDSRHDMMERYGALRRRYQDKPGDALIHKLARTESGNRRDPFHGTVAPENVTAGGTAYGVRYSYGIDQAVGGLHDAPNPGELLCAALASCADGLIRMLAGTLGIELDSLAVEVTGDLDVRGTLAIDADVPVGFQALRMSVHLGVVEGTPQRLVDHLVQGADRLCVNLATLRRGVPVETNYTVVTDSP